MSKYLNKDLILNVNDIKTEEVEIPEWGGKVLVKAMNGTERDSFEASIVKGTGKDAQVDMDNIRAKLVVRTIVGDDNKRLFNDSDAELLSKKCASALDKVFSVAQKLSGIGEQDLKDMVKNSETDPKEDSTSA
jgi:hypothetical protein